MAELTQRSLEAPYVQPDASYNRSFLFLVSVLALVTAGVAFSIRSSIAADLRTTFFDPMNPQGSGEMIGAVLGVAFLGFAITIAVGSPLLDFLGMRLLLGLSSLCFISGTLIVMFTARLAHSLSPYWVIWIGMALTGVAWGLVETVINPLAATLYPRDKTHKLNVLHAWWPGGIILGGLLGLGIGQMDMHWQSKLGLTLWQAKLGLTLIPAVLFGILILGARFPVTERVASGVSTGDMFKEVTRPFFILWFLCMFLTAASELAPGQWVDMALTRTVHMKGIWLLIYVSGLMFVMRHFAGTMAHRLSPVGLLWTSCLLASAGLLLLSVADSKVTGLLAATVWGIGVCYMWPTMLAAASERFPRGGALLMGLMGTAGTLSIYFVLPEMGHIFDYYKVKAAGGADAFTALAPGSSAYESAMAAASQISFRVVAILPAVLLFVFGAIWLHDKSRGGYRPTSISAEPVAEGFEPIVPTSRTPPARTGA